MATLITLKRFLTREDVGLKPNKNYLNKTCKLCEKHVSKYKGKGGYSFCETHQFMLREYGGWAREDRLWTYWRKDHCERCGYEPLKDKEVLDIENEVDRMRVARGLLIADHIELQSMGGEHSEENIQTLCHTCNAKKTLIEGDWCKPSDRHLREEFSRNNEFAHMSKYLGEIVPYFQNRRVI